MLNNLNQQDPHDYSKNLFVGTVVANDDPLRLRRVKVTIPTLFEEDDVQNLPWVAPMFMGIIPNVPGQDIGSVSLIPPLGAEVTIEFQMGSPLHGLYVASPVRPDSIPQELMLSYLHTYGWKDPAGNVFVVNSESGNSTIQILHSSGTQISVDNAGNLNIFSPTNVNVITEGDFSVESTGPISVESQDNVTIIGAEIHLN